MSPDLIYLTFVYTKWLGEVRVEVTNLLQQLAQYIVLPHAVYIYILINLQVDSVHHNATL